MRCRASMFVNRDQKTEPRTGPDGPMTLRLNLEEQSLESPLIEESGDRLEKT